MASDLPPAKSFEVGRGTLAGVSGKAAWLAWFCGLTAAAAALAAVQVATGWSDGITVLICGLFAVTLVKSFRDILSLDRETRLASGQVKMLREINDIAAFLAKAKPSVFRAHIQSLYTIFLASPTISQDNLIEVTHARLMARNKTVELFASILITLGLIGTIVGLLASVGGLDRLLDAGATDTDALVGGMRTTVAGLSTAFYTTLFGAVFGGVMLRILTSIVDAEILRYVAHLSELTEVHVLPAMRRTASRLEEAGYYRSLDAGKP